MLYKTTSRNSGLQYTPPRPLEAIEVEIQALEKEIVDMLKGITA
jgi:hypothetical protein